MKGKFYMNAVLTVLNLYFAYSYLPGVVGYICLGAALLSFFATLYWHSQLTEEESK